MDRFIVVQGLSERYSTTGGNFANWLVIDTGSTTPVVIDPSVYVDCGDSESRANTVAAVLNASV